MKVPKNGSGPLATRGPADYPTNIATAGTAKYPLDYLQGNGLADWLSPDARDDLVGVTTAQRVDHFLARYPGFCDELARRARQFRARTGHSCGVQLLIESARYDHAVTSASGDGFKLDNSFAPYFARLLMAREPDLRGFFTLRTAPAADEWIAARTSAVAA
jgi:hypothetical protein